MATEQASSELVEAILSKSWEELRAIESDGRLMFPEELVRLRADGKWERIPVLLRVPREHEVRKARVLARVWAKEEEIDPNVDEALFDNMDTICVLSLAIRNVSPPHEQWEPFPKALESKYDRPSLDALWAKLEQYRAVIDPRPGNLTPNQVLALVGAIAKERHLVPLVGFDGHSQTSFVITMASALQNSLKSKSLSEQLEHLTQALSRSNDS